MKARPKENTLRQLCNNSRYYSDARSFERDVYTFLQKEVGEAEFLDLLSDKKATKAAKARAAYLYALKFEKKLTVERSRGTHFYAKGRGTYREPMAASFGLAGGVVWERWEMFKREGRF